jgi:hypothetical protein
MYMFVDNESLTKKGSEALASMTIDDEHAISKAMREEEERAAAEREKLDKKHDAKLKADMTKDLGDKAGVEKKFQRLDHLLSKSKV